MKSIVKALNHLLYVLFTSSFNVYLTCSSFLCSSLGVWRRTERPICWMHSFHPQLAHMLLPHCAVSPWWCQSTGLQSGGESQVSVCWSSCHGSTVQTKPGLCPSAENPRWDLKWTNHDSTKAREEHFSENTVRAKNYMNCCSVELWYESYIKLAKNNIKFTWK